MESSQHIRFAVTGMTCGSCVRHVDRALRRVGHVESVEVDLRTGAVDVRFDPSAVSVDALADAIRGEGYGVAITADP